MTCESARTFVVQLIAADVWVIELAVTAEIVRGFVTVMFMADEAALPAASRATAVKVCGPFDVFVLSHVTA